MNRQQKESLIQDWDEVISKASRDREVRFIVTGNILQAFSKDSFKIGRLIDYTLLDGGKKKGLLLPEDFTNERDYTKEGYDQEFTITVPIMRALKIIQSMSPGKVVTSTDGVVSIQKTYNNDYSIALKGKVAKLKPYFESNLPQLTVNGVFNKAGVVYTAQVLHDNFPNFANILDTDFGTSIEVSREQAKGLDIEVEDYDDEISDGSDVIVDELIKDDTGHEAEVLAEEERLINEGDTKLEEEKRLVDLEKSMIKLWNCLKVPSDLDKKLKPLLELKGINNDKRTNFHVSDVKINGQYPIQVDIFRVRHDLNMNMHVTSNVRLGFKKNGELYEVNIKPKKDEKFDPDNALLFDYESKTELLEDLEDNTNMPKSFSNRIINGINEATGFKFYGGGDVAAEVGFIDIPVAMHGKYINADGEFAQVVEKPESQEYYMEVWGNQEDQENPVCKYKSTESESHIRGKLSDSGFKKCGGDV